MPMVRLFRVHQCSRPITAHETYAMSSKSEAPSPVIRYFLPGLVLGAVLGGTLATIVPEFAGSPGNRLDYDQQQSPSVSTGSDGEVDRDGRGPKIRT
jgi:hypothetical protein